MNERRFSIRTHPSLSRRCFLKLSALGIGSLLFPSRGQARQLHLAEFASQAWTLESGSEWAPIARAVNMEDTQQGRVQDELVVMYDRPSEAGKKVKHLWKDAVFPITDVRFVEDTPSHNKVWYQAGGEGFVHSGSIQPVRTVLNEPAAIIPEGGVLAEVTVPFTDAFYKPGRNQMFAYRFYYETTHWVIQVVYDEQGAAWYAVLDDKWEFVYYVPANHLRIVPKEELTLLSPQVPPDLKLLEVRLPEQVLIAYEAERPVFMARVATGAKFRDGDFSTKPGWYSTFHKRSSRHMAAGNLAANGYDLPGVPWISYFTESGISFHGTFWHNNYGRPRSHGCVNLTPQAAKWLYRWTLPYVPPEQQMVYEEMGTLLHIIGGEG